MRTERPYGQVTELTKTVTIEGVEFDRAEGNPFGGPSAALPADVERYLESNCTSHVPDCTISVVPWEPVMPTKADFDAGRWDRMQCYHSKNRSTGPVHIVLDGWLARAALCPPFEYRAMLHELHDSATYPAQKDQLYAILEMEVLYSMLPIREGAPPPGTRSVRFPRPSFAHIARSYAAVDGACLTLMKHPEAASSVAEYLDLIDIESGLYSELGGARKSHRAKLILECLARWEIPGLHAGDLGVASRTFESEDLRQALLQALAGVSDDLLHEHAAIAPHASSSVLAARLRRNLDVAAAKDLLPDAI